MSGIQILPRIVPGTSYVPTTGYKDNNTNGDKEIKQSGVEPHTPRSPSTNHTDDEQKTEQKPATQDNTLLIVVFAIIIVTLIVLILWLVARSDTGKKWLHGNPEDRRAKLRALTADGMIGGTPPQQQLSKAPEKVNHSSVIGNASEDELMKFANIPLHDIPIPVIKTTIIAREVPQHVPPKQMATIVEENSDTESSSDSDTESEDGVLVEKPSLDDKKNDPAPTKADNDADTIIDQEFSKRLEQFAQEPTDNDINDIKKDLDRTIEDMVEEPVREDPFPVQQLTTKGEPTGKIFENRDSLTEANFDYNSVVKCCNGNQKVHKGFKWRFSV